MASEPQFASTLRLPEIVLGRGKLAELPSVILRFGRRAVFVVRGPGLTESDEWVAIKAGLHAAGISYDVESVRGEPSPELVDSFVARFREQGPPDVVVGIGGGSVMDTAKAVAGLLIPGNSVRDHLEGVGPGLPYRGPALPLIALPTTAGTGSEATKNSVLSERGPGGFKRSFRDDQLIARVAIVDPDLLCTCPPELIATDGMDAVTQLMESCLSLRANPLSDATALGALERARDALPAWYELAAAGRGGTEDAAPAREAMAVAALSSGICLAQTGLGAAHGVASPLGAQFPIPHGAACGATLAAATRVNIAALEARDPDGPAMDRYATLGRLLAPVSGAGKPVAGSADDAQARSALVALLDDWRVRLAVPGLASYGVTESDIPAIVADSRGASMRTNPIVLTDDEIAEILRASL
jgi:alcohol dehydrogenase class IV